MLPDPRSDDRHPFLSLLYLIFLCVISGTVFTALAVFAAYLIWGNEALSAISGSGENIQVFKLIQTFSSIGTFVLPALFFASKESYSATRYLKLNKPANIRLIALATIIIFSASPFIDWSIQLNQLMRLPAFLKGLEEWMRDKEDQLEMLTRKLLLMKTIPDLLSILLVVAVIPALGEEFIFRGCLQRLFSRWAKSVHLGIWISAVIFSAIHLQFYGFLPRMILGALFGYLFFWSQNLWVPITAHFINNGSAVVSAWLLQRKGQNLDSIDKPEVVQPGVPLFSVVLTIALLALFYKMASKQEKKVSDE